MASMRDAMVRNLRQFTEQYLSGLVNWERVVIEIPDERRRRGPADGRVLP